MDQETGSGSDASIAAGQQNTPGVSDFADREPRPGGASRPASTAGSPALVPAARSGQSPSGSLPPPAESEPQPGASPAASPARREWAGGTGQTGEAGGPRSAGGTGVSGRAGNAGNTGQAGNTGGTGRAGQAGNTGGAGGTWSALAHLFGGPQSPVWARRLVISVAAGLLVGIWVDWRLGLTAAALLAIGDTIVQSRKMSVVPAAARVAAAQRRTQRRVAVLRPAGFVALHARRIPGSKSVIDHLIIGPPGVFAVDSEYWDRRLSVRVTAGNALYHGPTNKKERLVHARWEAAQASQLVGTALGEPLGVRPVMIIYGPKVPWAVATLRGVDVFPGNWARRYFRRRARGVGRDERLSSDQVARIYEAADRVLPPVS